LAGLRDLARAYPEVKIYAISPDSTGEGRAFVQLLASDHRGELPFPLLSDPGSRIIDRYALRDEAYAGKKEDGIPHPAVFVLDEKGRIRWMKVETDFRERPSNAEIAAAIDGMEKELSRAKGKASLPAGGFMQRRYPTTSCYPRYYRASEPPNPPSIDRAGSYSR
jgi:peroxiredoxin